MKNFFYILATLLICSSCYKEPIQDPQFAAEVNVVHLNSAVQHIDALLADERAFAHGLGHYQQSGYYKIPAKEWVELLLVQTVQQNILKREERKLEEDKKYTLLFFSRNGGTRTQWLEDSKITDTEHAFVRLINMVESNDPIEKSYSLKDGKWKFIIYR